MTVEPARTVRLLPDNSVWIHGMRWWHLGFYVALTAVALMIFLGLRDEGATGVIMIAAMAVLAAAYPFLTRLRYLDTWRPRAYVVLLIITVGFLSFVSGSGAILLFIAFPQIWMFSGTTRAGLWGTAAICVAVALGQLNQFGAGGENLLSIGLQAAISFLASSMLGLWIYKIIDQSEDRAELISELNAARAELAASHQQQGAMAERERMSREIHDTLAQGFTSIVMLSEAAQAQLRNVAVGNSAAQSALASIGDTARENLVEARALIESAGPSQLKGGDLLGALQRLKVHVEAGGPEADLQLPQELPPLSPIQQVAVLRSAQEALTNVRRHAQAGKVSLQLTCADGRLVLRIDDDGKGFHPDDVTIGYGLRSMSARLAEISGTVTIESAPGQGSRLEVAIPIQVDAAQDGKPTHAPAAAAP
ncbi:sensor histidine kinase [Arthrobacter sp. H5]|uniref:sensor histidine kinase n=1 Tax=Arthrobacter sp. H5 TaxID=1267973 RepID=UPI000683EF21|nr:sensor histidine kinase [Arthrobacter sp. H5]